MKFELKAFRDDKAQPIALEVVEEPGATREQADKIAAEHHLGAYLFTSASEPIVILYENGLIYVSPITDGT